MAGKRTAKRSGKKTKKAGKKAKTRPKKKPPKKAKKKAPRKTAARPARAKKAVGPKLYTLEVCLVSGPLAEAFSKKNKVVMRKIAIRGDQTLEDLHRAIFVAHGFEEEHMYEFQLGKGFHDSKGTSYVLPGAMDYPFGEGPPPAGDVTQTTIDSLGLDVDRSFGYWFDFGDDWLHQIDVVKIDEKAPSGKYPKLVASKGANPPQYVDWDEEDE